MFIHVLTNLKVLEGPWSLSFHDDLIVRLCFVFFFLRFCLWGSIM